MRRFLVAAMAFSLLVFGAGRASAANILYFVDGNLGTDQMATALTAYATAHPGTTVTDAASPTDFQAKISVPGAFDLGIFSAQELYDPTYSSALASLATFVQGGGKAIVNSWQVAMGSDITPFGATPTGDSAPNPPFSSTPPSVGVNLSALNTGVTNPLVVTNQGYGSFAQGEMLAPVTGSYVAGTFSDPGNVSGVDGEAAVVVGNTDPSVTAGGRSIVNGFMNDTGGAPGEQLYLNEIGGLLTPSSTSTPEPATLTLLGAGLLGMWGQRRIRRRKSLAKR